MSDRPRRVDLGDIAFVAALIVGFVGLYLVAGIGGVLAVGGLGAAAFIWRTS